MSFGGAIAQRIEYSIAVQHALSRCARTIASLGAALVLFCPRTLHAQLVQGQPIKTNDYNVDLYQGPVLASSRVTGLGGAYVAIAEGTDGIPVNPASPAVRVPYSFDHFDYDFGVSFILPSALSNTDFFNTGSTTKFGTQNEKQQDLLFGNIAGEIQIGSWALGASGDFQQYRLGSAGTATGADKLLGQFGVEHLLLAHAFADGQLAIGVGLRTIFLSVLDDSNKSFFDSGKQLFHTEGAGLETGAVWMPNDQFFRIGLALRSGVQTKTNTDQNQTIFFAGTADELYVPNDVRVPWEVEFGAAVQIGPRPLNPRWIDPSSLIAPAKHRAEAHVAEHERRRQELERLPPGANRNAAAQALESEIDAEEALDQLAIEREEKRIDRDLRARYARMPRKYVLISTAARVTGPASNAVGVESFLDRITNRSGERTVVSPRLGVETELVPEWVKVRAGTYGEPTRFGRSDAAWRLHGTLGFDVKLFPWTVFGLFHEGTEWRAGAVLDAAPRYLSWGVSIGVWH